MTLHIDDQNLLLATVHTKICRVLRVLILISKRTRQFMTLFSITFCKIRKSIPRFFAP
jgi:hypothetical protein